MDTSTLSYSADAPILPLAESPLTMSSTALARPAEPGPGGPDWLTRLISPLTKPSSGAADSDVVSPALPASSGGGVSSGSDGSSSSSSSVGGNLQFQQRLGAPVRYGRLDVDVDSSQVGFSSTPSSDRRGYGTTSSHIHVLDGNGTVDGPSTILLIFIPILVVVLTVLLGVLIFLIALLCMKRRKGIHLPEDGGPLDLSKWDGVIGEGGVDGVESRWLEHVDPDVREAYRRAKDWQTQYPPSSVPTDITLSQFLSIQEKGVSAWAFEPDYEENLSLYVQSRTEITFLSDGPGMPAREGGGNSVMANLPLPKQNEVYYWEVKLYDKPTSTEVAIGLATKPFPSFRLPGWNRFSVAYFASDGFRSHNYPFTASSYGQPLAEGDVLGVGYRPRTGTVFFTRNGRKLEDCYSGLQRLNLFPTVGANGPCTLHVNLGQAGFVFIEANVKKWGLAPMNGTLAPPPAYGSERGSILLDAGYGTPGSSSHPPNLGGIGALLEAARARTAAATAAAAGFSQQSVSHSLGTSPPSPYARPIPLAGPSSPSSASRTPTSSRHRRAKSNATVNANLSGSVPAVSSPLRDTISSSSRRRGPPRTYADAVADTSDPSSYVSPTDTPLVAPRVPAEDALELVASEESDESDDGGYGSSTVASSPMEHNPPTPNLLDISLHSLRNGAAHYFGGRLPVPTSAQDAHERVPLVTAASSRSPISPGAQRSSTEDTSESGSGSSESGSTARQTDFLGPPDHSPPPPGYAPLDPHVYSGGLPADLPEELINQAIAAMTEPPVSDVSNTAATAGGSSQQSRGGAGPLSWLLGRSSS